MRQLQSGRRGVAQGQAKRVVVMVHGYGADGADLLGLADPLSPHLPYTAFYAPDAPEPVRNHAFGRQWFPIPWLDGSSEAESRAGLLRAAEDLDGFLDRVMADEGVGPEALALVGFSQGAMMSLHIAPRRRDPVAGVVAIAGRLLAPDLLEVEAKSKPPVLLVHGDEDNVVPFADMSLAGKALQEAGFDVFGHVMRGTGHGIAPDGLGVTLQFLRERLPD
jgi:phospholipase/carboxylesterase